MEPKISFIQQSGNKIVGDALQTTAEQNPREVKIH